MPTPSDGSSSDGDSYSSPRTIFSRVASPVRFVMLGFLSFHPSAMPWLARANYARELRASFFLPWAIAATEGSVIGFIVRKLYDGVVDDTLLNYLVAALIAAPALANITSFGWAIAVSGRKKIPFITGLQLMVVVSIMAIAAAPRSPAGLIIIVIAAYIARICLSGVVTIRSTVWGVNYPTNRAKMTGKFQAVSVTISSLIAIGLGYAMQISENSYRILIPIFGVIALIGVSSYARIRVRSESTILAREQANSHSTNGTLGAVPTLLKAIIRVLYDDREYRRYQTCQFMIGIGNMMSWAPFVIIAKEQFGLDYLPGLLLTQVIPLLMMPVFIPFWAKFLDRVHIVTFRAFHSWVFVITFILSLIAAQADLLWLLYAASVTRGIAFGGGALAWNLGHLQYVKPDRATDYMAVHVTLTGVRGLTAPFIGVAIYAMYESYWPGEGSWVFAIGLAITLCGTLGFMLLSKDVIESQHLET
ncbi:MAG: MFS transporter [Phycisphaerales bacterium]